jgi:hypothetical protein
VPRNRALVLLSGQPFQVLVAPLRIAVIRALWNRMQTRARGALQGFKELYVNSRNNTKKLQHFKKHDYHRGIRSRGGMEGYQHREGSPKKVTLRINSLKNQEAHCILLEDGTPPHKSRIANDYLCVERIEKCNGLSPRSHD